jgi:hypothetical protein
MYENVSAMNSMLLVPHQVKLIPGFCVRLADVQTPGEASHAFGREEKSQTQQTLSQKE